MRLLSHTFRSVKCTNPNPNLSISSPSNSKRSNVSSSWCVYLILSTNPPIKTYVGVTIDFSRRLRQHNGEIRGGAKASRAGRPWVCACLIQGFEDQSHACEFESKWKNISRKLPYKRKNDDTGNKADDNKSLILLQHRQTALDKVRDIFDCGGLNFEWKSNPS